MYRAAFVGRERELAALGGLLNAACGGHGSLVLIDGEPGMGKTALANEVVHRVREQGWVTAWGSCQESEGAPAYWPWIQVLRDLDGEGDFFVQQNGGSRFRLFDEMIEVLRRSSTEGLLIVLDDLHWADLVSVRLLLILAAEIAEYRMLVLGLYRRGDLDSRGNEVLSAVARERATSRLTLGGLARGELERLAEMTLESRPEPALVRAVADRSEGNPFYALELLRLVRETGAVGRGLPRGVREAIGRRLDIVSAGTRQLLRVASVLGRVFSAGQLAELAGEPVAAVLGLLDEALARDLAVVGGSHTFRFAHALIQEVAYAELPVLDRQSLHQRAAAALGADGSAIDAFAHHLRQAASLGSAPEALTATLRAAARARSQLAYEHAAFQFRQALELWPLLPDPPVAEHELLLDLARCQLRSGAVADAWQSCRAAAELGLATGQAAVVADAATVIRGTSNANANPLRGEIHALCRQALVLLGGADPVRQAKVLAQLAITRDAFAASGGSSEVSERALRIAEASGDLDARFLALQARQVELVHPRHVLERLTIGERAVQLGQESGRHEYLMWGHVWRMDAFWELGRRAQLDRELAELTAIVQHLKEPLLLWRLKMIQACLAEIEGRFGEARELADEALSIGRRGNHRGADFVHLIFRSRVARLTGVDAEEAEVAVRRFTESQGPMARSWHGLQLVGLGRLAEAADALAASLPHIAEFPQHAPEWIPARTGTAALCARLDNREPAGLLYADLLPFANRQVAAGAHTGSEGPLSRYLGMLALLLGDHEAAEAHLKAALENSLAMNSPPYEALTRLEIARLLLARRGPGDAPAARENLEIALSTARRLGMTPLEDEAAELLPQITPLSVREHELAALIADGLSNRQIAQRLHLSERTVESHVRNILTKLGFERRTQIASWHTRTH